MHVHAYLEALSIPSLLREEVLVYSGKRRCQLDQEDN